MLVRDCMSTDVASIQETQTVSQAVELMRKRQVRRLPVMRGNVLVGIVADADLIQFLPPPGSRLPVQEATSKMAHTPVSSVMTMAPVTTTPDETLEDVALVMRRRKIGGIPVIDGGLLVGLITESDIFDAFCKLLGAGEPGVRLTLELGPSPVTLEAVLKEVAAYSPRVLCALTYPDTTPSGRREVILKLRASPGAVKELSEKLTRLDVSVLDTRVAA